MKNILFVVSVLLFIALNGCEQKEKHENKMPEAGKVMGAAGDRDPAPQVTPKHAVDKEVKGIAATGENNVKKSSVAVKEATEDSLANTVNHAQELTKSQKSESRRRGQAQEDEMLMEVGKGK